MIQNDTQTILSANCFFVKGVKRNLIIDFQNNVWYHIDFDLDISNIKSLNNISEEDKKILFDNQILIEVPIGVVKNFIPMNKAFEVPSIIEFGIVDRDKESTFSIKDVLLWFEDLLMKHCQFRYFGPINIREINEILNIVHDSIIESVEFIVPYNIQVVEHFRKIKDLNSKLFSVTYHSCESDMIKLSEKSTHEFFTHEILLSADQCGVVHPGFFSNSKKHVLKSINYNSCLYKKIGIDVNGNIKNCPTIKNIIGHVSNIKELSFKDLTTEYWFIKKDEIEICQDCEFRYICSDCRVKVDSQYSRPTTCEYNPYTGLWKGQEGYKNPISNS